MNNSAVSLLVGALIGTYLNNTKFKSQVDNGLRGIVGQSIDALNRIGGVPNASNTDEGDPTESN